MRHRSQGFTVIEILVVVGIIALLSALLFPALSRAREAGRTKVCLSNMKQLGLAMQQYVQDAGRRYPGAADFNTWWPGNGQWVSGIKADDPMTGNPGTLATTTDGTYIDGRTANIKDGALFPYVKSTEVYICPSNADGRKKGLSYSMNCALSFLHDVRVTEPTDIVVLIDEEKNNDGFFYAVDNGKSGAPGTSTDALTLAHNGGGNLLFADAHAKFYRSDVFPITSNNDPQYGAQSKTNKWRDSGSPRFHDRTFGPWGSNKAATSASDYCFATKRVP
jgi:prepilin-type N-terminal cleavage/methylation domain-containing protein/prepilin-type processing-associated H-X9-DG protein